MRAITFSRVLGLIYFIAFTSFGIQAPGLIGSHGILPLAPYLRALREAMGRAAFWEAPGVLWLHPGDGLLAATWVAGAACALVAIFAGLRVRGIDGTPSDAARRLQRATLAGCLVLWISICSVGQDFLSFQWDILLSEGGFLALFADASPVRVWLFRWLLFRVMFFSGLVKLTSGDPTWRNLTALQYHYWTQPLPTPLAWFMSQLPPGAAKVETAAALAVELLVPFLFFVPGRPGRVAGWITIGLQLLILATGNYTYFNFLTIALCAWLFIEPDRRPRGRAHRVASAALAVFIGVASVPLCLEQAGLPLPPGGAAVLHAVAPLRIVNSYGLFAVMTTERQEIVVEGSNDGATWQAYEFRYKPGDVRRAPPVIEPQQPRLDWQMWFAALGTYQENRWFVNFMLRLLEGEPAVLRLLPYNPFPRAPPRYVRARLFRYRFAGWGARDWWVRQETGGYFPAVSLK